MATTYDMTKKQSGFSPLAGGFSFLMEEATAEPAEDAVVTVPALSTVTCYLYSVAGIPGSSRWSTGAGGTDNFAFEYGAGALTSADIKMRCRVARVTEQNGFMEAGAWTAEQAADGPRMFSISRPSPIWADGDADDRLRLDIELRNVANDARSTSFLTGVGIPCGMTSPILENPTLPDKVTIAAKLNRTVAYSAHE